MKWMLCLGLALLAGIQAKPKHGMTGPEIECLEEEHLTMNEVLPYVHKFTSPEDKENVGPYLACVWKKLNIITEKGLVNGEYLAKYILDIYESLDLTEDQKNEVKIEYLTCEQLEADKLSTLAIKVKNCMLAVRDNFSFLEFPKH